MNSTPLSSIPEGEEGAHSTTAAPTEMHELSSLTPHRHKNNHVSSRSKLPIGTTAAGGRHHAAALDQRGSDSSASNKTSHAASSGCPTRDTEPYSPPSPYSLSPSPSPPHSPATGKDQGQQSTCTHSTSQRNSRVLGSTSQFTSQDEAEYGRHGSEVHSGAGVSPSRKRTPRKSATPRSVGSTPASTGHYKRSLDASRLESRDTAPFSSLKGSSLMERFEATYSSLKSHAGAEQVTRPSLPPTDDDDIFSDPEYSLSPPSRQRNSQPPTLSQQPSVAASGSLAHSRVLSRAPSCPHITVTGSDGRRVYLRIKDGGRKGGVSEGGGRGE